MRCLIVWIGWAASSLAAPIDGFIARAGEAHGAPGERAARFLVEHMPAGDRESLSAEFLSENLDLAFRARAIFPWGGSVPEPIFLNDVLPYAVFDEPRHPWRADFLKKAAPIVRDAGSASEAAQLLNKEFFRLIRTHYSTDRKRTNQSPSESIEQGKATCTGLSIILVDACRAVGIPARAVGTPMWTSGRGNHTWVEIWDGEWHFTGADEFDEQGLDRGWFAADAAKARADQPEHAIYATSWEAKDTHFPMPWSPRTTSVGAVNVTTRYAGNDAARPTVGVRLRREGTGDTRIAARGSLTTRSGNVLETFETKAGTSDLNDLPRPAVKPGSSYRLRFEVDGRSLETDPFTAAGGETTMDVAVSSLKPVPAPVVALTADPSAAPGFTAEEADRVTLLLAGQILETDRDERVMELKNRTISLGDKTLEWLERSFGKRPDDGRSLWISMHGGGNAPPELNDRQWKNQARLYQPEEGIYVTPRAPTNTWNLWHEAHIDPLFSRLIENMVAIRGVNPDKVYLMGYSAGGDGVWQLAPRMADRFAAAAMMAGHPNEARLDGLRNLPFAIFVGGGDNGYGRNKIASERAGQLDQLRSADPGGYPHMARIYPGLPHWMDGKDAEALPWMAKFTRRTWPRRLVWFQDDITHDRFYWLRLPDGSAVKNQRIVASIDGQGVKLEGDVPAGIRLLLHDRLLDLDQPVAVTINNLPPRTFNVTRSVTVIRQSLKRRFDPNAAPCAAIVVD